jgi:hypothetical protein
MIKRVSAVTIAALALGLAPLAAAQAATAPATAPAASKALPNPCKTFTAKSADALFGVKHGTHLPESLSSYKTPYPSRVCSVSHGATRAAVVTRRHTVAISGPFKCYKRPRLGAHGRVCVSTNKALKFTYALFRKDGVWLSDAITRTLPRQGSKLYQFALPQYKHFKG